MSTESINEEIWNTFYDINGQEPKDSTILMKFIKWNQKFKTMNITYKTTREIFKKYKGKGRINKQDTISNDMLNTLPTHKAKRDAKDENLLKLVSILKLQLLVNGYIRNMTQTFMYIIPSTIYILCLSYCHLPNIVIRLNRFNHIQVSDLTSQNSWKSDMSIKQIKPQEKSNKTRQKSVYWSMLSGMTYKKSVNLPSQIFQCYKSKTADIIFQGQTNYCHAILFNQQFEYDQPKTQCHQYDLPKFPVLSTELIGNNLIFDEHIGLISIGGGPSRYPTSTNLLLLPWKDEKLPKWNWKHLPSLSFPRGLSASVMLENNKFMVISGISGTYGYGAYHSQNSVEIYDLNLKHSKLTSGLNRARFCAGVCYDDNKKRVYLGGGVCGYNGNDNHYVESYDTEKDKWYASIPKTLKPHKTFPIVWTQNDGDLLFIASLDSEVVEFLDLRVYGRGWNIMLDGTNNKDSLLNVPGSNEYPSITYRLLK